MAERRQFAIAALAVPVCAAVVAPAISTPTPRLVWNASASAPIGLYRTMPGAPVRAGDLVIARLPAPAALLAARRHYLPPGVPLVKRVVAVAGFRVCAVGHSITIDGKPFVRRLVQDSRGRALPGWVGCRKLRAGEVFLVMAKVRDSFDGRYFGPTGAGDVIAKVVPLWVR